MWSADLIDIHRYDGYNKQHKFILTMIDNYSKQVWLRPLKNKEAIAISRQLRPIFEKESPIMLNIDNGGEFRDIQLFQEFNIKIVNSASHVPISIIENLNGQVRKFLSQIFVHTGTLNWIDHLADVEKNINDYNSLPKNIKKREKKSNEIILKNKPKFKIDDFVRVKQSTINNKIRAENKQHQQKYIHVKYSIRLYKIYKVYKPRKTNSLSYYELIDVEANNIIGQDNDANKRKLFREIDLQLVPENSTGIMLTQAENTKLNQTKAKRDI